jgi:hypothetical protein
MRLTTSTAEDVASDFLTRSSSVVKVQKPTHAFARFAFFGVSITASKSKDEEEWEFSAETQNQKHAPKLVRVHRVI